MYIVLHVNYQPSAFAVYSFLARILGVSEKTKSKAGKAKRPENQVDNPKLAAVIKRFFP